MATPTRHEIPTPPTPRTCPPVTGRQRFDTSDAASSGGATGGGGAAADGQGNGVAPVAGVQACADRKEQIPGDPNSPPCVAFTGDNGAVTAKGVTADKILVSYRVLGERGFQQTLTQLAGASLSDTPETIQNTISASPNTSTNGSSSTAAR